MVQDRFGMAADDFVGQGALIMPMVMDKPFCGEDMLGLGNMEQLPARTWQVFHDCKANIEGMYTKEWHHHCDFDSDCWSGHCRPFGHEDWSMCFFQRGLPDSGKYENDSVWMDIAMGDCIKETFNSIDE